MKKMTRMLSMLALALILAAAPASALSGVYDQSDVFTTAETDALLAQIDGLEQMTGWEFAVVTTDDAAGKTAQAYADDFWDTETVSDGALVLFDFDNSEVYISCEGDAMAYYTDERIESMLDDIFEHLPGDYAGAATAFLTGAEDYYRAGMETDEPVYHVSPGDSKENYVNDAEYQYIQPKNSKNYALIVGVAVLGGLAAGGVSVGLAMAKYRLKLPDKSYDVREHAQLDLSENRDEVIGHIVTHRRIPRNDNNGGGHGGGHSSGGTTIHHSSSGRVHSGGGRHM